MPVAASHSSNTTSETACTLLGDDRWGVDAFTQQKMPTLQESQHTGCQKRGPVSKRRYEFQPGATAATGGFAGLSNGAGICACIPG